MYAVGVMTHLCYSEMKMLYAKFRIIFIHIQTGSGL